MPRLNEWREVEKISEWMICSWKEASNRETQIFSLPLLPLLASSINIIRSNAWKDNFGERGNEWQKSV